MLQDLVEEDVMILDTYSEVFVWIGHKANEVEKKESLKIVQEYIETDPSGRDLNSTLLLQVTPPIGKISLFYTQLNI